MLSQTMSSDDPFSVLKKSPLFNLSLSSKELFHSNFLAWLWEQYPEEMHNVFKPKLAKNPQIAIFEEVLREDHNLDLTIKYKDGYQIVIENKVKSLPNKSQLQEYSDKLKGQGLNIDFVLLSLTKPSFLENEDGVITLEGGFEWRWMSYDELAMQLRKLPVENTHEYHYLLLQDYINFIEKLALFVRSCQINWDSEESFFDLTSKHITDNALKKLRIHDLILKVRYAELAEKFKDAINVKCDSLSNWIEHGNSVGQTYIGSGMTRSMGLFDLKYVVADKVVGDRSAAVLGVQLQGNSFRLDFELIAEGDRSEKIAQALLKKGLWFNLGLAPELEEISIEYPKVVDKFNKFGSSFYYRSKILKNISVKRLVEIIMTYFNHIQENLEAISTTIADANIENRIPVRGA